MIRNKNRPLRAAAGGATTPFSVSELLFKSTFRGWLQGLESNQLPPRYERSELPMLYPATRTQKPAPVVRTRATGSLILIQEGAGVKGGGEARRATRPPCCEETT